MSLSGHSSRFDRKRRDRWRMAMVRLVFYGGVIGIIAYWAYAMGGEHAESRNRALESQMTRIAAENRLLRTETDAAVAARASAVERATSYRRRYESEVPRGEVAEIMAAVRARLEAGVEPARIGHVVAATRNEGACEPETASRRFIVQTPLSDGSNASVSFAGNLITVTGNGETDFDAAGNREAWFDPAKPVTVAFTLPGGGGEAVTGALPLYHSVVIDDHDHRFTIATTNARGFVIVTERICAYP